MRADWGFRRCLADYGLVAGAYERLAAGYDSMFDDDALANQVELVTLPGGSVR
jgi:hypothetical protein